MRVEDLRCERMVDPIGIGTATPRLSWTLEADSGETEVEQVAFQVQVGVHGDDGPQWDTGRLEGDQQQISYGGPALHSQDRCWWRVRAWTTAGDTGWSSRAAFELGLVHGDDWTADMITATTSTPVVRFWSSLRLSGVGPAHVARARLRLTAHGIVVARLNGEVVGDEVLIPGWQAYRERLAVRTWDVARLLRPGDNELELTVAPGWFSGRLGFREAGPQYGSRVGVLAELEVQRPGGHTELLATGPEWQAGPTGWTLADLYDGETFDLAAHRAALAGGQRTSAAVVDGFDPAVLVAPPVPPVRRIELRSPATVKTLDDGTVAVDLGQNLVGWLRLHLRSPRAGQRVIVRHAEVLGPDGRLFTEPLRTARATDQYAAAGDPGGEVYEPCFTFHGFRYTELTGVAEDEVDVEAVVVHSDLERTGTFECSDPLVNRLHDNVVWGWRGNSVSVPTDCPQRDERLGWTGDAQVFAPTADFLFDCETFWEGWLADLAADQHADGRVPHVVPDILGPEGAGAAGWGDAAVTVPWSTYEAYGDAEVLRRALPSMVAWVDWVHSRLDDELRWRRDFQFGDWLDPDAPADKPWKAKARFDLVATAYAAHSTRLATRAARLLGEVATADRLMSRATLLRSAWWQHHGAAAATTQTGCALGIGLDLAPSDRDRQHLGDALAGLVEAADDHLATGFLGTPLLLPALTVTGHVDVAYRLLEQDTCPSWLYQVQAGATTVWERWDALRPDGSVPLDALGTGSGSSMVSFNHYAYGSVADWLHRYVAGLRPVLDAPGYRRFVVEPHPGGRLHWASAALRTRFGPAAVSWSLGEDGELGLSVKVPPGTRATVRVPGLDGDHEVGSGRHTFTGRWSSPS